MNKCTECKASIAAADKVTCSRKLCGNHYHLLCANLTADTSATILKSWKCSKCNKGSSKNQDTPTITTESQVTECSQVQNVTIRKASTSSGQPLCDSPAGSTEVLDAIRLELPIIIRDMLKPEFHKMQSQMAELDKSVKFISARYDDVMKQMASNNAELKALREENQVLRNNVHNVETRLHRLEIEQVRQDQWVRLQNIEISGLPENKEEQTVDLVLKIAEHVGVPTKREDIEFAHRVQTQQHNNSNLPRNIVARLKQRSTKDAIVAAARKLRGINLHDLGLQTVASHKSKVYVNEHLTKYNKNLLKQCKLRANELSYKYIWTKNCRIYLRRVDGSQHILVLTEEDLKNIT